LLNSGCVTNRDKEKEKEKDKEKEKEKEKDKETDGELDAEDFGSSPKKKASSFLTLSGAKWDKIRTTTRRKGKNECFI